MAKERNALKAGLFILISLALALAVVLAIQGLSKYIDPSIERQVSFMLRDDLGGLRVGDDVRIGGYKVGDVRAIELVQQDDPRLAKLIHPAGPAASAPAVPAVAIEPMILVTFSIPKKYVIREGATVRIQSAVTPGSWLNFESLGTGANIADNVTLVGRPGSFTQLLGELAEAAPAARGILRQTNEITLPTFTAILADVRYRTIPTVNETAAGFEQTAYEAKGLISDVRGRVPWMVGKYDQVTDSASGLMDELTAIFGESKTDLKGTAANLNAATARLSDSMPQLLARLGSILANANEASRGAADAMEDVKLVAENARDFTAEAKSVLVGNRSRIDGILISLGKTAKTVERGTDDVLRNPWKLLYKPGTDDQANITLFNSARQFADAAADLKTSAETLRDALKDRKADPRELQELMNKLQDSFSKFGVVEKELWENVRK